MKVSQTELCTILGVDAKTVRSYTHQGMPVDQKGRKGKSCVYDTRDVREWLEQRAVQQAVGNVEGRNRDYWETLTAEQKAKQEIIKTSQMRKDVIAVDEIERIWSNVLVKFGARLDSLTNSLPPALENKNRRQIKERLEKEIRSLREMLSQEDPRDESNNDTSDDS